MDFNIDIEGLQKAFSQDAFWEVVTTTSMSKIPEAASHAAKAFNLDAATIAWQIESYKKALKKYPSIAKRGMLFPPPINLSQSSSEITAVFKTNLFRNYSLLGVVDCTGGFGLDSIAFLSAFGSGVYCEKSEGLRQLFKANTSFLALNGIEIFDDFSKVIPQKGWAWFADPSRRDDAGARVFFIEEFAPNPLKIVEHFASLPGLLKLPPMLDLSFVLDTFPSAKALYVVSVKNECKELLLSFDPSYTGTTKVLAVALNGTKELVFDNKTQLPLVQKCSISSLTESNQLFVPDVALSKAKLVDSYVAEKQMQAIEETGLFLQNNQINSVMGKTLSVLEVVPFKLAAKAIKAYARINVAVSKNFPLKANILEQKLKIVPGGAFFLYGVRNQKGKSFGIIAKWINLPTEKTE